MRSARHILFAVWVFSAVACSEREYGSAVPVEAVTATLIAERNLSDTRASQFDAPIFVGEDAAPALLPAADGTPLTRTTLDADWLTTRWGPEDRIAIWATDRAGNYQLALQPFARYVQTTDDTAVFTSDLAPMPAGRYNYLAFYPVPEAGQIEGTQLTYALPQVQDGTYRAELDVLSSDLVEGPALTDKSLSENILVPMHHRYHALRIGIPAGRNHYGAAVARVLIDFPQEVVGRTTFDITHPEALPVLTEGSRRIDVQLQTPFESMPAGGQYIWAFVAPGQIDGPVAFTVVYEDGFCAETLWAPVQKTLAAGRVTPIYLTASEIEQPLTWLDFTIDHAQLGEAVDRLTVDAPEGVSFRKPDSRVANGRCSYSYYSILCGELLQGARLTLHYDSAHALVSDTCTLPAALNDGMRNVVSVKAPYLLEEDFSGIGEYHTANENGGIDDTEGYILNDWGLNGWNAARGGTIANTCIMANCYIRSHSGLSDSRARGRIDTCPLSIKTGAKVNVKVSFDTGYTKENGSGGSDQANSYATCTFGRTDVAEAGIPLASDQALSAVTMSEQKVSQLSDTSNLPDKWTNQIVNDCSSSSRLTWQIYSNRSSIWATTGVTIYCHIDNIRVSIAQ